MKQLTLYKKFLEYLSEKEEPVTYGRIMHDLQLSRTGLENLFRDMQSFYTNEGHNPKEQGWQAHLIKINHQGIEYLRNLKLQEINDKQNSINRFIGLTGGVLAFVAVMDLIYDHAKDFFNIDSVISFWTGIFLAFFLIILLGFLAIEVFKLCFVKK